MPTTRRLAALPLALVLLTIAAPAAAQERSCYRYEGFDVVGAPGGSWETVLLASLATRARVADKGVTVEVDGPGQMATVTRGSDGLLGHSGRHAWSAPPQTWCSDGAVELSVVILRERGFSLTGWPSGAIRASGVEGDGPLLTVTPAEHVLYGDVAAAPAAGGPEGIALVATMELEEEGLSLAVRFRYVQVPAAELASTAPTAPTLVAGFVTPDLSEVFEEEIEASDEVDPAASTDIQTSDEGQEAEEEEKDKRSYLGDVNSGWFHVGGGGGMVAQVRGATTGGGRFTLGFGGYTFLFYGGAGFEMDWNPLIPWKIHGVGYLGVAIPVPVVHPLVGIKVGGGGALTHDLTFEPSVSLGAQAGVIIRGFDRGGGIRIMFEPAFALASDVNAYEMYLTLAAVF
jgi:hypothetical protein